MDFCRTVELLYAALAVRPFRDWLIRIHMDRCPRCQERLLRQWAAASAMAAVIALTGFWLLRETGGPGFDARAVSPADRFEIAYIKVGGAPAQTFVYQPQGTDTVFVWAQKTP